jgi:hypothetical protein
VIAKITRGADGAGLVRYLMGEGRAEEHTDQRVIAAADMVVVPIGTALSPEEVGELGRQLDAARTLYGTEVADGHVWHLALSNPAGDRQLSDTEWAGVVRDAMSRLGFSEASGKAPCRWVAVRHGRSAGGHDHVHVAVSLVREDGMKASIWRDRVRMSELCAESEARLGLTVVDGRQRGGLPGAGRAEVEASARRGRPEPERVSLARLVRGAAVASGGEAEFVRRLRAAGAIVRPRYTEGGTAEVVGYSVALRPAPREGRCGSVVAGWPGTWPCRRCERGGPAPRRLVMRPWQNGPGARVAMGQGAKVGSWPRPSGPTRRAGSTLPSSAWAECRRGSGHDGQR